MTDSLATDRIVIAGASGFIGQYLAGRFRGQGASVSLIGRRGANASWDDPAAITDLLEGADLLVNLAGKSVNCRYTAANRAEILRSRVDTTRRLAEAIRDCREPPALWINSSTATIYRHADDRPMTESTGELGDGFSVGIAKAWEAYMANFDPTFLALRPSMDKLPELAKDFKIYYKKVEGKTPGSYTMDHSAGSYVYDAKGRVRLYYRYGSGVDALTSDIRLLLKAA